VKRCTVKHLNFTR